MTMLLIYLAIAIGVSFLCSILEAVLLSVTPSHIEQVTEKKPRGGKQLAGVKDRIDESLSSILILNTFAHTMGAAGVGAQAIRVFGPEWETLIAVLLTLAILYFSEIIPKTLGATFWRSLSVPAAYVITWLVRLVYPLVWLSTRITQLFSKNTESEITRDEILALASIGHKDGSLFAQENEYLSNLLRLREIRVEEILTPRLVTHMLDGSLTVSQALDKPNTQQFSRIPVYVTDIDNVVGCILRIDLYQAERSGNGDTTIDQLISPITRVSEKLPVDKLLDIFIRRQVHLALVEDEFGQTAGVVSLEDAIETLLGREIIDESDSVADLQALAKKRYRDRLRQSKE